jgi:peptidoglycan/xylan/chitin deacetylase (PgdA/CDA1 family)
MARRLVSAGVATLALGAVLCLAALPPRASAGQDLGLQLASATTVAQPHVIPRSAWGADESLRFNSTGKEIWPPVFWPIQKIIIHHTETQNFDPDPAATIRTIYRDDARQQGLGDISYNFLIDEEGRIYEGRHSRAYGRGVNPTGQDQFGNGVSAAHAYGHNPGTVGIALLGSLDGLDTTPQARGALEHLVAWIAATHHIDPVGSSMYRNPATGAATAFPNIAGHRDVNQTACPGQAFYATLPSIRAEVGALIAGKRLARPPRRGSRGRRGGRKPRLTAANRRENGAIDRVRRHHPVVSRGGGRRHEVALVFHDGPGPYTMQMINKLRELHAAATFFDVGASVIYFSQTVTAQRGHRFAVGNLTESYAAMTKLSRTRQRTEIGVQADRLRSLGIPSPKLFSPPYGAYNRDTLAVLRRLHMLMVLWSVDTEDYKNLGEQVIVQRALHGARPGSIILLHDAGGDRTQTLGALPAIVHGLRSRGYKLVTVPRLMLDDPPRP